MTSYERTASETVQGEQYPVVTADVRFHGKVRRHPYLSDRIVHVTQATSRGTGTRSGDGS